MWNKTFVNPITITTLTNWIFGVVEVLIGLRVILKLFGASTTAAFVQWVYSTTEPLLQPFLGMFPSPELTGGFELEFSALFGLIVYSFVGYLIVQAIETLVYRAGGRNA